MRKIKENLFFCKECKDIFEKKGDKIVVVKDKEKVVNELAESLKGTGSFLQEIAEAVGVEFEEDERGTLFGF